MLRTFGFTMHNKQSPGRFFQAGQPFEELIPIRVSGKTVYLHHSRFDLMFLSQYPDLLFAVNNSSAQRAVCLIAYEHYRVLSPGNIVDQVCFILPPVHIPEPAMTATVPFI